ncbi:MAG TPA: DEAD/DEAH box helicase [Fimbriimonas sp.]|nr:DEAD/DEAH box helicase [Fimbriimonas sp.]
MEELPPRAASFARPERAMHPSLVESLERSGLELLYTHQAAAYDAAMDGKDVVVVTGTNSGKTMCYNLPALQLSLSEPAARCFYMFPTKALAQDQLGKLVSLMPDSSMKAGTYDGDTPQNQRGPLRKMAHILLTNPDMLHVGILPSHDLWSKFLKALRLIVIDEMHVYRGVFGSNVGNVLRRLLRLCEFHHNRPQIIACSATIGNPLELFEKLTGRRATLIDQDGSPSGKRTFVFFNPPEIGEGARLSANIATSEIIGGLVEGKVRTLAFNRARVSAELVLRYTRKRIKEGGLVAPEKIESYRAGYTAKERRQIEQALFRGDLLGLAATNAMELGVDVGALDAVVMNGYPGTASSFWQQAGRAGRGTRDGLAIFVAHDDPLEQFLVREPGLLLNSRNESVSANPANPQILSQHLLCAAHEKPIAPHELHLFGDNAIDVAEHLDRSGELSFRGGLFFYPGIEPPAFRVNIRGAGGDQVRLYLDGQELGTMERWRAMTSAHEGAVYLHRGQSFVVIELDLDRNRADVIAREVSYYTQSMVQSVLDQKVVVRETALGRESAALAGVSVTDMVTGFRKKSLDGDTVLATELLDLPPVTYDTICVRVDLPELDESKDVAGQIGGMHGAEHALMAVAPLLAGCDRGDLGSAWYTVFHDTMKPAVFIFDKTPGGVGLCDKLYDSLGGWTKAALQLLTSCKCDSGCPGCLLSARCESGNEALSKEWAVTFLKMLI